MKRARRCIVVGLLTVQVALGGWLFIAAIAISWSGSTNAVVSMGKMVIALMVGALVWYLVYRLLNPLAERFEDG